MKDIKKLYIGIDEVGRGSLAGPVSVGLVICSTKTPTFLEGIKDSKKMTAKSREKWVEKIKEFKPEKNKGEYFNWGLFSVSPKYIDEKGIVPALEQAVKKGIADFNSKLKVKKQNLEIISDHGIPLPKDLKSTSLIKGDQKEPLISLASVVSKVHRDDLMIKYSKKYPEYAWHKNKGYGTKEHKEAIKRFGFSDLHRKTFCRFYQSP